MQHSLDETRDEEDKGAYVIDRASLLLVCPRLRHRIEICISRDIPRDNSSGYETY